MKFCKDCRHSCVYHELRERRLRCARPELIYRRPDTGEIYVNESLSCLELRAKPIRGIESLNDYEKLAYCGPEARHFDPRRAPWLERAIGPAVVLAFLVAFVAALN